MPNDLFYPLIVAIIVGYVFTILCYSLLVAILTEKVTKKYYPNSNLNRAFHKNGRNKFTIILFFTSVIVGLVFLQYFYYSFFNQGILPFVISAIIVSITLATALFRFTNKK